MRDAFTADVKKRISDYKNRRYSGWEGGLLWAKDKIFNLPKEADQEYVAARLKYESDMAALIGRVADTIGIKLTEAKDRIAKGRADIKAYVDSKPKNLQKVAQERRRSLQTSSISWKRTSTRRRTRWSRTSRQSTPSLRRP